MRYKIFYTTLLWLFLSNNLFASSNEVINVYNWANYIPDSIIKKFEQETQIKVNYDIFDSNKTLETKLLVAGGGYDVVFPSMAPYLVRQIDFDLYEKLDFSRIENYQDLDPIILELMQKNNNSHLYAIPFAWGTTSFAYNVKAINERMADAPTDSLAMIFDPNIVKKFADCGVEILDTATEIIPLILNYYGKKPYSGNLDELDFALEKLLLIRPYLKSINNEILVNNLASGESCLVLSYSGDINLALKKTNAKNVKYSIAKEGVKLGLDVMAIPQNAPNKDNAYKFINFILQPKIMAQITNYNYYPNALLSSKAFLKTEIRDDPTIYTDLRNNKIFMSEKNQVKYDKKLTRTWLKFISNEQ